MSKLNGTPSTALCLNFTAPYLKTAVYGRAAAGTLSCVVCIVTVTLIVVLRSYHRFVHRLSLYLAIAGFFYALLLALQGLPVNLDSDVVSLRPGWENTCVAIGFLAQYTGWGHIVVMTWISLYALNLLKYQRNAMGWKSEIVCIVVSVVLPLLISVVPFYHNTGWQERGVGLKSTEVRTVMRQALEWAIKLDCSTHQLYCLLY